MQRYFFPLILLLAFALRIVGIGQIPSGFTPDEASFGYDAYSIIKTGKDQWGKPFPMVLESFGDFKSPIYAYLTIPSVSVFGLTVFAVRLPNALLGVLSIVVVYLLCKEIIKNLKLKDKTQVEEFSPELLASFLLAISPWHVMLSRGAFEANLITFFIPLAVLLFLRHKFNLSSLIFGLSLFTYHSAKLIAPLVFIFLLISFRIKKLIPIVIFTAFIGIMFYTNSLGGAKRIAERSITNGALEEGAKIKIQLIQDGMNPIVARLMHNKYQVTIKRFITNYRQYFSSRFLVKNGPAETTYGMISNLGVIYFFELFLLLGLTPILLNKNFRNLIIVLLVWLLISPIPASLATGVGFAGNRAAPMIIPLHLLFAFGAFGIFTYLNKFDKKYLKVFAIAFAFLVSNELLGAYKKYFIESPKTISQGMLYGNLEVAKFIKDIGSDRSVIVDKSLSEPHIYFAFMNQTDPKIFQEATKSWKYETWVDQMEEYKLENITFKDIKKIDLTGNSVLVGRPVDFQPGFVPDRIFYYPNGEEAIYAKVN